MLDEMLMAKAKRDGVRERLVSLLKTYELPQELQDLVAADDAASEVFWQAYVKYEQLKALKGAG